MKRIKIMAVCGFGIGSSLILKMKIEKALAEADAELEVFCNDVTTAAATDCDIIFTSAEIAEQLKNVKKPIVIIKNFMKTEEIQEKGIPALNKLLHC